MIKITEEFINSTAPNQSAITNAWGLVKKNSFVKLNISRDETVLFGECKGSGADHYRTSADFIKPESPVFRCSCPSRQFPCKHSLGLMYAYVSGKIFEAADVPPELLEKREKAEKREEKKKEQTVKEPKKVNKSALTKKIQVQLEGLELLEKLTCNIAQWGLGTINAKTLSLLEDQAKQLGNYYIPGAQTALREFIILFKNSENAELIYTEAVERLTRLYTLCSKGREYLKRRLEDPELSMDTGSTLDEWLGHTWQLSELKELGRMQTDTELVQLSFHSYVDEARQEFVDLGLWLNLKTGQIQETRNYRPFRASKYIREEDSFFQIAQIKELFVYPGDMNPRVRWEGMTARVLQESDYVRIRSLAHTSFAEVVKAVKNQIKNPLSDKHPVVLLEYVKIAMVDGMLVMEDTSEQRLVLEDQRFGFEPPSVKNLVLLDKRCLYGQCVLVRFHHHPDTRKLRVQPLSLITGEQIIRLVY